MADHHHHSSSSSSPGFNPLRAKPFYSIPGINPDDSVSAQMEQIDQLNTLLLQDIDHNFARFHQVVTSRLLPEIKRFALASEPTRDAAKFWRSFFEAAAAVPVPQPGEFTTTMDNSNMHQHQHQHQHGDNVSYADEGDDTFRAEQQQAGGHRDEDDEEGAEADLSISSEDHSFLYGNPVSSTPMGKRTKKTAGGSNPADVSNLSWDQASSMDSPFEALDRKLKENLQFADEIDHDRHAETPSLPSGYDDYSGAILGGDAADRHPQRTSYEDYEEEPSVLINRTDDKQTSHSALAQTESASATPRASSHGKHFSLANQNPFLKENQVGAVAEGTPRLSKENTREKWNGIADLRTTPLNIKTIRPTTSRPPSMKKPPLAPPPAGVIGKYDLTDTFEDDPEDDLALDMSPPVTMNFGLPMRNLSRTPAKEAARLVIDDLMKEMGGLSPSPGVPTPPAFAKYSAYNEHSPAISGSPSYSRSRNTQDRPLLGNNGNESEDGDLYEDDDATQRGDLIQQEQEQEGISEIDQDHRQQSTFDEGASTVGMQRGGGNDEHGQTDSFADDSFDVPSSGGVQRQQPQYRALDDSVGETSTLELLRRSAQVGGADLMNFSPASSEAASVFGGPKTTRNQGFALMRPDEMETYHGGRLEDAGLSPRMSPSYGLAKSNGNRGKNH